ncbi:MAG: type II secretion system F family protein [Nanoarchaeota archaeon]|nr:type II secretion system F family protein [Nanoarchaeota archaeon]
MRLKFRKIYFIGIFIGLMILTGDFFLFFSFKEPIGPTVRWFYPLFIIGLSIGWSHFWYDYLNEIKRQKRIAVKFLDFVRNMGSAVKSGISIPSSILQASKKDYGDLNPYLKKLANQIRLGIPIHQALMTFSKDTGNNTIKRSITIVIEAEASGGDIQNVLESVTGSLVSVKKLKEERKSSTYSQIVQGYIVYFVFIAIMLVLQLKLFPKLTEMSAGGASAGGINLLGGAMGAAAGAAPVNLDAVFFGLIMIQGFFAGIMIGKFSEGSIKQGLIHSLILITLGALIITTIKGGI